MRMTKNVYEMTDRELRAYKRKLRRQKEIRRRCMMVIMSLCLICIGVLSYHAIQTSANTGEDKLHFKYYTEITVQYGETLWDIADDYIDYNEYRNKSSYIAEVKNINHLDADGSINAGQRLIVPYYSYEFIK